MWAFELLGLGPDADERSIKRAYAQRLRGARPDEDPAGFQRLRDAYELALRLCAHRAEAMPHKVEAAPSPAEADDVAESTEAPMPPEAPAPVRQELPAALRSQVRPVAVAARPAEPLPVAAIDLEQLQRDLLAAAERGEPEALRQWLGSRHELWSLHAKAELGRRLMARLQQHPAAMPGECFDALLAFFDLDHVQAGYDPFALQRLRRRMRLQWELQPEHIEAMARRTHDPHWPGRAPNTRMASRLLRQLVRPFQWWQALAVAVLPERPAELARFAKKLSDDHVDELLPYVPREQLRFWLLAGQPGLSLPRSAVHALRIAAGVFASLAAIALLFGVVSLTGGNADKAWAAFPTIAAWIAGIAGLIYAFMGWQWLDYWQRSPESPGQRGTWLRWACVPLIAAIGLVLKYSPVGEPMAGLVELLAIVLSVRRYRERSGAGPFPVRIHPVAWIVLINIVRGIASEGMPSLPLAEIGACIALGFWIADAWKERGRRRQPRRATA